MKPSIAATLICICCHTAASHACETTAPVANLAVPRLLATAAPGDAAPMVRRTAAHTTPTDATPMYAAGARALPVAAPAGAAAAAAAPAPDTTERHSETLLAVALALMAGIALRRWGSTRP